MTRVRGKKNLGMGMTEGTGVGIHEDTTWNSDQRGKCLLRAKHMSTNSMGKAKLFPHSHSYLLHIKLLHLYIYIHYYICTYAPIYEKVCKKSAYIVTEPGKSHDFCNERHQSANWRPAGNSSPKTRRLESQGELIFQLWSKGRKKSFSLREY